MGGRSCDDSFQAPTALLEMLERDLRADGKRSVKECLRSKAIPCPQVKNLLKNSGSLCHQEVILSYDQLVGSYLEWIRGSAGNSCLWFVSRCATILRFVELLLEINQSEQSENTSPQNSSSLKMLQLDHAQISTMILQLIQGLVASVCVSVLVEQSPANKTGDAEMLCSEDLSKVCRQSPQHVALFCLGSLFRMNHYIQIKPFLISPLWKGICEIALAVQHVPSDLTKTAVRALIDLIRDGSRATLDTFELVVPRHCATSADGQNNSLDTNEKMLVRSARILAFLLVRLGTFLSFPLVEYTTDETSTASLTTQVSQVVFLMRGLGDAIDYHLSELPNSPSKDSVVKAFKQLSTKSEKCFTCWFWASSRNGLNDGERTDTRSESHLCQLRRSSNEATQWDNGSVANLAYTYGKTCILVKALEDTELQQPDSTWNADDVDAALRISEHIVFRCLPLSMDLFLSPSKTSALLSRSIFAIAATLISCETRSACLETNALPGRASLFHFLAKWFSGSPEDSVALHPLARELVLSVVHLYVVGRCRLGGIEEALPFLTFLVKILVDVRPDIVFRKMVATSLSRMLRSSDKQLRQSIAALLTAEGKALLQTTVLPTTLRSKKRKRHQARQLAAMDLAVIASVLSLLGESVCADVRPVPFDDYFFRDKTQLMHVSFCSMILSDSAPDEEARDQNLIFCGGKLSKRIQTDLHLRHQLSLLGIAATRQVSSLCCKRERQLRDSSMNAISLLLDLFTKDIMFVMSETDRGALIRLPIEAIRTLSAVGQATNPSTPKICLETIASSFKRILSHKDWLVRSYTMSSFVRFVSTVSAAHKNILPLCFPPNMQILLQNRLQDSHSGSEDKLDQLRSNCWSVLLNAVPPEPRREGSILVASKSIRIASDSLIMHMPTQEGRSAVVIFPPGQQSTNDIYFMLGIDPNVEDGKPEILKLHCSVPAKDGACKLIVR
jgi:hypothetical protein